MFGETSKSALFATVAFGALVLTANTSFAAGDAVPDSGFRPYVSLFGGASFPSSLDAHRVNYNDNYSFRLDTGYILGANVGVHVTDQLRAELELSRAYYRSNGKVFSTLDGKTYSNATGGIRATYLLANAWLDIPTGSSITPYLGGGAGVGWIGGDLAISSGFDGVGNEKSAGFAFQLGVGVKTEISPQVSLDVGYRFKDIIGATASDTQPGRTDLDHLNLTSHNIQIGLTYNF